MLMPSLPQSTKGTIAPTTIRLSPLTKRSQQWWVCEFFYFIPIPLFSIKLLSVHGATLPPSVHKGNNSLLPLSSTCHSQREGSDGEFFSLYFICHHSQAFSPPIFSIKVKSLHDPLPLLPYKLPTGGSNGKFVFVLYRPLFAGLLTYLFQLNCYPELVALCSWVHKGEKNPWWPFPRWESPRWDSNGEIVFVFYSFLSILSFLTVLF
jgi:hypothetical protein